MRPRYYFEKVRSSLPPFADTIASPSRLCYAGLSLVPVVASVRQAGHFCGRVVPLLGSILLVLRILVVLLVRSTRGWQSSADIERRFAMAGSAVGSS